MKISFAWCLTITALVLTLVPSILIWAILCNVLYSSLDLLETTTVDSIIGLSAVIEQQLLDSARNVLLRRLAEGDREMAAQVDAWEKYNCSYSTDVLIAQSCQQLHAKYGGWQQIPEGTQELVLNGSRYWAVVGHSSSSDLEVAIVLLKNRFSVMGAVETSNYEVGQQVALKRLVTYIILAAVTVFSIIAPLAAGLWLGRRLLRLANKMDKVAGLQFDEEDCGSVVFSELHTFQRSFAQMQNGLQAFGRFVPSAVVKVLIAGSMRIHEDMSKGLLTVLFADIAGFSTITETIATEKMVEVCTEYFERMCMHIVQQHGTIDKFIGDCIMAMWNAPLAREGHEVDAIAAALGMQNSIFRMQPQWKERGLPALRFRLGLHTGECLVGNFGCKYRVNYTCLGDAVNLASRLEALNKKFGTVVCVSHATFAKAAAAFHFRLLADVTVPGKSEVLTVYEPLATKEEHFPVMDDDALATPLLPNGVPHHHSGYDSDSRGSVSRASKYEVTDVGAIMGCPAGSAPPVTVSSCHSHIEGEYVGLSSFHGCAWPGTRAADPHEKVVYQWALVDLHALLIHTERYERAYGALVAGRLAEAGRLLATTSAFTDGKAWQLLRRQYEELAGGGKAPVGGGRQRWDGVFYFTEK